MEDKNFVQNKERLEKMVKEIYHLASILLEYCKNNVDTIETECLYTGLDILYKKADTLNLKMMELE